MRVAPGRVSFQYASHHHLKVPGRSHVVALLLGGAHQVLYAASSTPFAAPEQVVPSSSTGGLLRVVVALLVVLGAVIVAARLARRVRGLGSGTNSGLEVLGQLPLSARERAVLVRVGEHQLLLGVAPGNVRTLHVFEDQVVAPATPGSESADTNRPSFKAMLLKSLGK
jgi:flagellar biosynthetic protein FliO